MSESNELDPFRHSVREWLEHNFPPSLAGKPYVMGTESPEADSDVELWRQRLADKGWGAPTWSQQYGGAGLSHPEAKVISQEIARAGGFNPIPVMAGMGVTMVGPTIMEYGSDDQKARHLPDIASGKVRWCLGLSEPNAGSDLASLTCKAEVSGDSFMLNGQKTWTSGADISQWCGALVRTDSSKKKRDGISFVLLPMAQAGVETRPIALISGASPFCETFFNDAIAEKRDLLGPLNEGWSVVKRLLQHERQSQTTASSGGGGDTETLQDMAKRYAGSNEDGALSDSDLRGRLALHLMDAQAHKLTVNRITAEARGNVEVSAVASILKNSATKVSQDKAELTMEMMGSQGLGWEGDNFEQAELENVRGWLWGKAMSIYGGSFEVQNNIISKNILGLPETTQKG
ncbi:MAG: alkylation response protein AidB-like acyl-CoA dehydrogenase [Paraglaciecola psychrophila]|jgi:alkylation response protein AidB-like acyl-CoA dehydrogenase